METKKSYQIKEELNAKMQQLNINKTSDGLPYSISVDNPYSLRGQLYQLQLKKKMNSMLSQNNISTQKEVYFAGWSEHAKPRILEFSFE